MNKNREDYVKSLEELKFLPGALEAVARLSQAGFRIVIISNQQGVGRGLISPETLKQINHSFLSRLADLGGGVAGVYYCPHLKEDDCGCRKPKPGMLLKAAAELKIDLARSIFIGDSKSDMETARAAGCGAILVLSGKTTSEQLSSLNPKPDHVAADLPQAAEWILKRFRPAD